MSDTDDLYRVLFLGGNGHEQLTGAMSLEAAQARARALQEQGYTVGSVMEAIAAKEYMDDRYSPTYRGVKVPDGLRVDGAPRRVYEAWKHGVDATLDAPKAKPADVDPFAPDLTMSRDVADYILRAVTGLLEEGYWPKGFDVPGRHGGTDGQDHDDDLVRRAADTVGRNRIVHRELLRFLAELDADAEGGASS